MGVLPRGGEQASRWGILVSISHPKITSQKQIPGSHSSSISLLPKKPKEELAKGVMGLVMCHSDAEPLLGVLGGEVALTSQKHRTEKDLKGSSCPFTSKRQDTALSPWRARNGYSTSSSHFCRCFSSQIEEIFLQLEFLFNSGLLLSFTQEDELVSIILLQTSQISKVVWLLVFSFQTHQAQWSIPVFFTCIQYGEEFLSALFAIFPLFFQICDCSRLNYCFPFFTLSLL